MIAVVHGGDATTARAEAGRLATERDPSGNNTTRVDGQTAALADLTMQVGTSGFFGECRVIVVTDLLERLGRRGTAAGNERERRAVFAVGELSLMLAAVRPQNLLILVDTALTTLPVGVEKALPTDARITNLQPPRGRDLLNWIRHTTEEEGGKISQPAVRILAESTYPQSWQSAPRNPRFDRPPDLGHLRGEITKLVLYAHPAEIEPRHVQAIVSRGDNDQLPRFGDAAVRGQLRNALPQLESIRATGEDTGRVLAHLFQQVELLATLGTGERRDPVAIGRDLGLPNPNRMLSIALLAQTRSPDRIVTIAGDALAIDRALKSGRLRQSDDAIYEFLTLDPTRAENANGDGN